MKQILDIFKAYVRHDGLNLSAVISFYAILSAIPLILIMISITAYVLGSQVDFMSELTKAALDFIPKGSKFITNEISGAIARRTSLGGFGIVVLFFTASLLFSSIERALGTIFEHAKNRFFLHSKLLSFLLIFVVAVLMFLPTFFKFLNSGLEHFGMQVPLVGTMTALSYLLAFLTYVVLLKILPACKVHWRYAFAGGVCFVALLWVARILFKLWISFAFSNYTIVYGSLTALVILVLWIFYISNAFLISSEVVSMLSFKRFNVEKKNRYV